MKYKPFIILTCPACGRRTNPEEPACHWCGLLLSNRCGSTGCEHLLDGNARFCVKCGDTSMHYKEGLLVDWEEEVNEGEARKLERYVFKDEDLEAFED